MTKLKPPTPRYQKPDGWQIDPDRWYVARRNPDGDWIMPDDQPREGSGAAILATQWINERFGVVPGVYVVRGRSIIGRPSRNERRQMRREREAAMDVQRKLEQKDRQRHWEHARDKARAAPPYYPEPDTYRSMTKQHLADAKRSTRPWSYRWFWFLVSQIAITIPMLIGWFAIVAFFVIVIYAVVR
jgi:hypothetical protein